MQHTESFIFSRQHFISATVNSEDWLVSYNDWNDTQAIQQSNQNKLRPPLKQIHDIIKCSNNLTCNDTLTGKIVSSHIQTKDLAIDEIQT